MLCHGLLVFCLHVDRHELADLGNQYVDIVGFTIKTILF